jgi:quercetin dioxygenase-like cupin family protein
MRVPRSKRFAVLVAAIAAIVVASGLVGAALAGVFSTTVLADGTNVHLFVVKRMADGFDSGWHIHPGLTVVQVQEGSVQVTQGSCTAKTYNAGDTFLEVPDVPIRAVATGRFVWTATYIVRYEDPIQTNLTTNPCP